MRCACLLALVLSLAAVNGVEAQSSPGGSTETRPATPTTTGDTGLWFVPTAEVLAGGRVSFSAARTESDFSQGFTDVSQWPISGAVGIGGRTEVFGALNVVTRIDRDTRPLFSPAEPSFGGVVNEFPSQRETFSGNKLGDLFLGAKVALMSERTHLPMAVGVRGYTKLPTASEEDGVGTGKTDWFLDGILSKDLGRRVETTGYMGYVWRGDPDGLDLSNGVRWGLGATYPSRARVRLAAEFDGEFVSKDDVVTTPGTVTGVDGTLAPVLSTLDNPNRFSLSLKWQARAGAFVDAGLVYAFGVDRSSFVTNASTEGSDSIGFQMRIGWHRGVGMYVPPPPPVALAAPPPPPPAPEPAPVPPAPAPPPNQMPRVTAQCNPCEVESGQSLSLSATGQDPDGDTLRFRWSTPSGVVADPTATASNFTAPAAAGSVPVTVTVDDGRGGTASQIVTILVRERPVGTAGVATTFDNVHFDFDQTSLSPEGTAVLDQVVKSMLATPGMRIQVDGHTDSIGTSAYNQQLSQRRAETVRTYLVDHGVTADRVVLESFGETRPERSNDTAADRAVNRRAVVTVRTTAP